MSPILTPPAMKRGRGRPRKNSVCKTMIQVHGSIPPTKKSLSAMTIILWIALIVSAWISYHRIAEQDQENAMSQETTTYYRKQFLDLKELHMRERLSDDNDLCWRNDNGTIYKDKDVSCDVGSMDMPINKSRCFEAVSCSENNLY